MNYAYKFDWTKPKYEIVLSKAESDDEECSSDEESDVSMNTSDGDNDIITLIEAMVDNDLNGAISSVSIIAAADPLSASDEHMLFLQETCRRINSDESIIVT